jgi:Golgi SNAP receptor complex protein 2
MLSELIAEDKRRICELEQQLAEFEKGSRNIYASDIFLGLEEMTRRLDELEKQASKESKTRRDDMRRRVQHLKNSHTHVKLSLENLVKRRENSRFETEKKELFGNASEDYSNIDLEMAESDSLSRSSNMINNYVATGREALNELLSQKDRLKGVQRKVLDILNLLGISGSIMKAVERRDIFDKWLVYIGMILITLLLFFVWWMIRR